ncbi:MAG: NADP-dependent oxidoreductase [Alistipes sp.]|nr:NADP-dependent oxidoreductase [Alistipes sp.]
MKAVRIHNYGGPEALVYEEAPRPEVGKDQVLVEVIAVSVNHIDVNRASGTNKDRYPIQFPWTPGVDFAGRIDYVPEGEEDFRVGDEVYGKVMEGSYADYIAVDKASIARLPAHISFAEAASVPHVGLTAWEAVFDHGRIEPGQTVLIQGAAGAVGSYATQLVKLAGGFIYAVANGQDTEYLMSLGADVVIDYKTVDFTTVAKEVDLVLDFVGGDTAARSYPVMKRGGRLVSTAAQPEEQEAGKFGITATSMGVHRDHEDLKELTDLIEAGKVRTDVADIYPVAEVRKAWEVYTGKAEPEKKYTHGQIVIELQNI